MPRQLSPHRALLASRLSVFQIEQRVSASPFLQQLLSICTAASDSLPDSFNTHWASHDQPQKINSRLTLLPQRPMHWTTQQLDALSLQPRRRGGCRCRDCFRSFSSSTLLQAPEQTQQSAQSQVTAPDGDIFVYHGPLSTAVRRLKKLSIFSCIFTLLGSPVIIQMGNASASLGSKAAIAATLGTFGCFTTGLLHWFTGPYVHHLVYRRSTETLEIDTISLLSRPIHTVLHLKELEAPQTMRPQVTFQARGTCFYVDADNFADKELLSQITKTDSQPVASES